MHRRFLLKVSPEKVQQLHPRKNVQKKRKADKIWSDRGKEIYNL